MCAQIHCFAVRPLLDESAALLGGPQLVAGVAAPLFAELLAHVQDQPRLGGNPNACLYVLRSLI